MAECSENMCLESGSFKSVTSALLNVCLESESFKSEMQHRTHKTSYHSESQRFRGNGIKKSRRSGDEHDQRNGDTRIHNIHRSLTFISPNILLGIFLFLRKSSAGKCQQWLQHIKNHDERENKYTYLTKNHCCSILFSL